MELAVADNPEQAQFEIRADGELAGFVQYHLRDGVIAFLHAETDPRFRGYGAGSPDIPSTPTWSPMASGRVSACDLRRGRTLPRRR